MPSLATCGLVLLAAGAAAGDLKEVEARKALRVLVAADEQPEMFSFSAQGPPGFERELVEGFARSRQLKVDIVPVRTFDQIVPMLLKGDGDLVLGIIDTESRRQLIDFTAETLPARHLVVNRRPAPAVDRIDDFRKLRVGVVAGSSWAEAAAAAGVTKSNLASYPDLPSLLEALRAGKVAATVMSTPDFALAQRRDPAMQPGVFIGPSLKAAWGVRKTDPALQRALNQYLQHLRNSPDWGRLVLKYFTADAIDLFKRARN